MSLPRQNYAGAGMTRGPTAIGMPPRRRWSDFSIGRPWLKILYRLDNLIARYEEPSSMVRWDSPLFTVPWTQTDMLLVSMWKDITEGSVKPPNASTQAVGVIYCYHHSHPTHFV